MVNVYIGREEESKSQWEPLESFDKVSDANKYVQTYLKDNVKNLMFVKQRTLSGDCSNVHLVDYGFEKCILIEDTSMKEAI